MKFVIIITAVLALAAFLGFRYFGSSQRPDGAKSSKSLYDYSYTSIDGKKVSLDAYKGKKILIVNVASECGFTPQYEDLEKVYEKYHDKLVIVGFPANDFGAQEPGTNEQIVKFCTSEYGVTFPLSEKVAVIGKGKHPVYQWLTDKALNGWNSAEPKWNFHKYLVSETGELLAVFPSATKPGSDSILAYVK